ncbi:MAG: hypothetical protein ABIR96_04980 [Bdellovibrionota bacterium]
MISFFSARSLAFIFLVATCSAHATLLSDSFLGFERSALQDALPGTAGDDPFQSIANPAWVPETSRVALLHTTGVAALNSKASKEKAIQLLALVIQERKARLSYGFFAILPSGSQAIVDTGDSLGRSSPWMNMNRQLLYAANVSRSFSDESYRIGVLVPVTFDAQATARTKLATADVDSRASVSLTPHLSWALGAQAHPVSMPKWAFSLLYKEISQAHVNADIEGNIPLLALDLTFRGESAYSYDPRRLSLNAVYSALPWNLGVRVRYSQWSNYELPFVKVTDSSLLIEDTMPTGKAMNSWDVALGAEKALDRAEVLAFSLGWRQSPFKKIESFHDTDHAILGMGWSREFSELWSLSATLRFHILSGGVLYSWGGLGLGYRL